MGLAAICFVVGFDIISGAIGVIAAVLINPGKINGISCKLLENT